MYQSREFSATVRGSGAIALDLERISFRPAFRETGTHRRSGLNLVTNLAERIGSGEWFRGVATCLALCGSAYALAPGLEPLAGMSPAPLSTAEQDQAAALAFAPLGHGAGTGRRVTAGDAVQPIANAPERPRLDLLATVGAGDGFARVLERSGIAATEARLVATMVGRFVPLDQIEPGTILSLTVGRRADPGLARPLEALAFRARLDLSLSLTKTDGRFVLTQIPIAVDQTPLRIQGTVGGSLYQSARAAGVPVKAVAAYIRAIATQIEIGELQPGDRFDMVVQQSRAEGGQTEIGNLLYAGLDRETGRPLQLMQWEQAGKAQWFEASGAGRSSGMLQRPVPGSVSSNFGLRRHPILGFTRMHKGLDFRAGYGTPILAATDGRITRAGWAGGYGQQVRIAHAGGLTTSYSHMSRIVAEPGEWVRQGELIGYVGSTGLSTGPHLHYELHRNGVPIDPAGVRFTSRTQLSGDELEAFKAKLNSLLAVRPGATARTGP